MAGLLLLVGAGAVFGQSVMDRPANLVVRDASLPDALRQLQRAAGVALVYSPDLLPRDHRATCACDSATVGRALEILLAGTGFSARSSGMQIRLVPNRRASRDDESAGVILGLVSDADGRPVANAMIQLAGRQGVLSDGSGRFVLRGVAAGLHRLTITSMGHRTHSVDTVLVKPSDTTRVVVRMAWDAIPLPEVLVAPGSFALLEEVTPSAPVAFTREEIETGPQLGEDIFRAMKRLPGVASHDISTRLNIRGGSDREMLVRLDGLELREPYHLKDWEGALGIVDLNALGGVEMTAGGFGAEYGDRLTGVLDMSSRTSLGSPVTTLGLSVTNATGMSRGGFAQDRGSWLVSARRGFMDLAMSLIGESDRLSPDYYDAFAKVQYEASPGHLLSAQALYASDAFLYRDPMDAGPDTVDFESGWRSSYGWLTWDAKLPTGVSARTVGWIGHLTRSRHGVVDDSGERPFHIRVDDDRAFTFGGLRSDAGVSLDEDALLRLGVEAEHARAEYAYRGETSTEFATPDHTRGTGLDSSAVALERTGTDLAAHASLRARVTPWWVAEVGLRYDRVSHTGDRDLSPRLLTTLDIGGDTRLRASWGVYRQSQGVHELEVGDGETTFRPGERAEQWALGIEREMAGGTRLRVEAYRRAITDPRPFYVNMEEQLQIFPEAAGDRLRVTPERARAQGVELLLERRSSAGFAWSASYVLARAEDAVDGAWMPRRFDQRHALALFAAYQPDPTWNVSVNWQYHSGWPATAWGYEVEPLDDGWNLWTQTFGQVRATRLPAYHRLDVRVSRTFNVGVRTLQAFLDLFNVYDRQNLASFDYVGTYRDGRLDVVRRNGQELLPFLPTLGLRYEF